MAASLALLAGLLHAGVTSAWAAAWVLLVRLAPIAPARAATA